MFRPSRKNAPSVRLATEDPLALSQIRHKLSFKPSFQTLRNWCSEGILNKFTGKRVVLESIFLSTGRATTLAAVHRFLVAINEMGPSTPKSASPLPKPRRAKKRSCSKKT